MALKFLADHGSSKSLAWRLRRKRFEYFRKMLQQLDGPIKILDVGGTDHFWLRSGLLDGGERVSVTLLNVAFANDQSPELEHVVGTACEMPFPDKSFDVVYSNSVIEHVGDRAQQRRMAEEIQRVGKSYFVQTPNFWFPIEPHFLFPGYQYLPLPIRTKLLQNFKLGWMQREPDLAKARDTADSVKLLKRKEFVSLFPGSTLYDERILGLSKSFIVHKGLG
jgi:hypothetical protein